MTESSLIPNFDQYFAGSKAAGADLIGKQNAESGSFLKQYSDTINGQESQSAMAKRLGDQYNLPTLSKNAFNAQTALNQAPEVTTAAARGSDINQNQLDRQKNYQIQKLAPIAQTAQSQADFAQGTVNTQMGYATADQQKALSIFPVAQQLMMDRQARETSLFTTENQNELNGLIAKMNAGITLDEGQKNRAQQLSIAEKGYQSSLDQIAANAKNASSQPQTQTVSQGGKTYLIDSQTGKIINTYGSGSGGSTYTPNFGTSTSANAWS